MRLLGPWIGALLILVLAAVAVQTILAVGTVMAIESDDSARRLLRAATRRSVQHAAQSAVITVPPFIVLGAAVAAVVLGSSGLVGFGIGMLGVLVLAVPVSAVSTVVLALGTVDTALAPQPRLVPATAWRVFRNDKFLTLRLAGLFGMLGFAVNRASGFLPDAIELVVWLAGTTAVFMVSLAAWHAVYRKHEPETAPPARDAASVPAGTGASEPARHAQAVADAAVIKRSATSIENPRVLDGTVATGQPAAKWLYCDASGMAVLHVTLVPPRPVYVRCCPHGGGWLDVGRADQHSQQLSVQLPAGWVYVQVDSQSEQPGRIYLTIAPALPVAS